jgi:anti-sigma-K factor RskA
MMDKDYILENGILEIYLLSEFNETEQIEVERAINTNSELESIFIDLEANFEKLAFENAINPPPAVKDNLIQSIGTKIIPLQKTKYLRTYLGIASGIAACLFIGFIWLYTNLDQTKKQLQIVENQKLQFSEEINGLNSKIETADKLLDMISSPDVEQYVVKGNSLAPDAQIVNYINHKEKLVVINTKSLPMLDDEHDYQMWADVEGKMINMGLISKNASLVVMNYIEKAESLNITIEPEGGSDNPNVAQLIGNVYL